MIKWPKEYESEDYRRVASELMHMGDDPAIEDVYQLGLGEAAHMLELIASQSEATPTIPSGHRVEAVDDVTWTKKAAEFIEKKAEAYAAEFGHDDMGSVSFGAGRGADQMEEYWMNLIDLAEDFRKIGGKCQVPPEGWECSRIVGHDGPCAASPSAGGV